MHRFSSRSDERADLTKRATEGTAGVLYGTPRSMSERNTVGAQRTPDDFVAAVENICKFRADHWNFDLFERIGQKKGIITESDGTPSHNIPGDLGHHTTKLRFQQLE